VTQALSKNVLSHTPLMQMISGQTKKEMISGQTKKETEFLV